MAAQGPPVGELAGTLGTREGICQNRALYTGLQSICCVDYYLTIFPVMDPA